MFQPATEQTSCHRLSAKSSSCDWSWSISASSSRMCSINFRFWGDMDRDGSTRLWVMKTEKSRSPNMEFTPAMCEPSTWCKHNDGKARKECSCRHDVSQKSSTNQAYSVRSSARDKSNHLTKRYQKHTQRWDQSNWLERHPNIIQTFPVYQHNISTYINDLFRVTFNTVSQMECLPTQHMWKRFNKSHQKLFHGEKWWDYIWMCSFT